MVLDNLDIFLNVKKLNHIHLSELQCFSMIETYKNTITDFLRAEKVPNDQATPSKI